MSLEPDARQPRRPGDEGRPPEYGIDDLVRHEKRQTWFVAALLLGAVVVTIGRQMMSPHSGERPAFAPVTTASETPAPIDTGRE